MNCTCGQRRCRTISAKINILSRHTADRIAAGEVVERPASVVKELVENSIDAGATSITIETNGGGIDYIRVTDNGSGISSEDSELAFLRHATSKIKDGDDLVGIGTLGFRGEALASIAAVSKVRLRTKPAASEPGTLVELEAGEVVRHKPDGCPDGTTIEVSELFYNTPARKKFLKHPGTEAGYISDYIGRMILARPDIAFKLTQNGKAVYKAAGDGELESSIFCVYGAEVMAHLKRAEHSDGKVHVFGYAGTEKLARPNRLQQSFYVNSRYIKSQKLSFALQRAYDTRLMKGKFPFAVLNITLPTGEVDVNVHPTKLDVRFLNEKQVLHSVTMAARLALSGVPSMEIQSAELTSHSAEVTTYAPGRSMQSGLAVFPNQPAQPAKLNYDARATTGEDISFKLHNQRPVGGVKAAEPAFGAMQSRPEPHAYHIKDTGAGFAPASSIEGTPALEVGKYTIVGQLFQCYWVVQQGEWVYFIDQHAAHERSLYEKLASSTSEQAAQQLLTPLIIRLEPVEYATLMENLQLFLELGFDIAEFGTLTVAVRSIPHILGQPQTTEYMREAISQLQHTGRRPAATELKRQTLMQTACKHAVKGGMRLLEAEIEALLNSYINNGTPLTCPHGRPVMVRMSKAEFEKLFKRIV